MHKATNLLAVTIGIPLYSETPSESELSSFVQCCRILNNYPFTIITNKALNVKIYTEILREYNIRFEFKYFDKVFFESINGYNQLMLTSSFYEAFAAFRYLLIYQLDAFVFSDHLSIWCAKGYDYIGAPWPNEKHYKNIVIGRYAWYWKSIAFINRKLFYKRDWYIGNGGFSLRNVKKSAIVLKLYSKFANKQDVNEDLFWSIYAPLLYPLFKVPNLNDGIGFAFESNPEIYFKLNNNRLPFGCHGWNKYNPIFWAKYIKKDNQSELS